MNGNSALWRAGKPTGFWQECSSPLWEGYLQPKPACDPTGVPYLNLVNMHVSTLHTRVQTHTHTRTRGLGTGTLNSHLSLLVF